jgi:hypothetical protein
MTGYFGSKAALGLYQNIIAMMPPHDTYIETPLGGGAVMRNNIAIDRAHWATYAGKDFTDRQRIKRKAERWAKNYQALPPGERLALLAAIMAVETD